MGVKGKIKPENQAQLGKVLLRVGLTPDGEAAGARAQSI